MSQLWSQLDVLELTDLQKTTEDYSTYYDFRSNLEPINFQYGNKPGSLCNNPPMDSVGHCPQNVSE